ncbi:hypothetical protein GWI73_10725 [Proteus sp. G2661]|uniref:hypothetical protein n=1 Tax=Proteus sp. G2661 TaxID=2698874 RepID=UPI001376C686|nr:hypothetical protein [Proteus sp. G2661]NBM86696.1 hypothetical protein [Proteus sp. G2661]
MRKLNWLPTTSFLIKISSHSPVYVSESLRFANDHHRPSLKRFASLLAVVAVCTRHTSSCRVVD